MNLSTQKPFIIVVAIYIIIIVLKIFDYTRHHELNTVCQFFTQNQQVYSECAACVNLEDSKYQSVKLLKFKLHNLDIKTNQDAQYTGKLIAYQQLESIDYQCGEMNIVEDFNYYKQQSKQLLSELRLKRKTIRDLNSNRNFDLVLEKNQLTKGYVLRFRLKINSPTNLFVSMQYLTESIEHRIILLLSGLLISNLELYFFLSALPIFKEILQSIIIYYILRQSKLANSTKIYIGVAIIYFISQIAFRDSLYLILNLSIAVLLLLDNQDITTLIGGGSIILAIYLEYTFLTKDFVWSSILFSFYLKKLEEKNEGTNKNPDKNESWQTLISSRV